MYFHQWKFLYFDSNFIEVPNGPIDKKPALVQIWLGAEQGQAITWTNVYPVHRRIYAALWEMS